MQALFVLNERKQMHTKAEMKALNKANDILSKTDLKYVLITKDESEENPQSYFALLSDCTENDILFFTRYLLEIMYTSGKDYLPEDLKPSEDKTAWMKDIMKKVTKKVKENKNNLKVEANE